MLCKSVYMLSCSHSITPESFMVIRPEVFSYQQSKVLTSHNTQSCKQKNPYLKSYTLSSVNTNICVYMANGHIASRFGLSLCCVNSFYTGHWTAKSFVKAFPASSMFYHCSLWSKDSRVRRFNIGLMKSKEWPLVDNFATTVMLQSL